MIRILNQQLGMHLSDSLFLVKILKFRLLQMSARYALTLCGSQGNWKADFSFDFLLTLESLKLNAS